MHDEGGGTKTKLRENEWGSLAAAARRCPLPAVSMIMGGRRFSLLSSSSFFLTRLRGLPIIGRFRRRRRRRIWAKRRAQPVEQAAAEAAAAVEECNL